MSKSICLYAIDGDTVQAALEDMNVSHSNKEIEKFLEFLDGQTWDRMTYLGEQIAEEIREHYREYTGKDADK